MWLLLLGEPYFARSFDVRLKHFWWICIGTTSARLITKLAEQNAQKIGAALLWLITLSGIRTQDLTICLYLNLKLAELDHSATIFFWMRRLEKMADWKKEEHKLKKAYGLKKMIGMRRNLDPYSRSYYMSFSWGVVSIIWITMWVHIDARAFVYP